MASRVLASSKEQPTIRKGNWQEQDGLGQKVKGSNLGAGKVFPLIISPVDNYMILLSMSNLRGEKYVLITLAVQVADVTHQQ